MNIVQSSGVTAETRETYLHDLFEKARVDPTCFNELTRIASGRNDLPLARELFDLLENTSQRNEVIEIG